MSAQCRFTAQQLAANLARQRLHLVHPHVLPERRLILGSVVTVGRHSALEVTLGGVSSLMLPQPEIRGAQLATDSAIERGLWLLGLWLGNRFCFRLWDKRLRFYYGLWLRLKLRFALARGGPGQA